MTSKAAINFPVLAGDVILNSLPDTFLTLDENDRITSINNAGEQLFSTSARLLHNQLFANIVPPGSPLLSIIRQSRRSKIAISEYDLLLGSPKYTPKRVDVHVALLLESPGDIVLHIQERSIAKKIKQQLNHQDTLRSVSGMASVLAHEIKNPLSGIRGSAQLLEQGIQEEDRDLIRLICEEADRICALVDRIEVFSSSKPLLQEEVNLHLVLSHVRKLAQNGFGRHVTFRESYDPSIPSTRGDKDQLIQVFLNLVKNAVEALPAATGEITLTTAYRHGVKVAVAGASERIHLPLEICVIDNGVGIADDVRGCLFDPFVTSKPSGTGLGLALVAKIIADHGGMIECDSLEEKTVFRILLPNVPPVGSKKIDMAAEKNITKTNEGEENDG